MAREQDLSVMGQNYKLLSILQNGIVLRGSSIRDEGPQCQFGGSCPAVIEDGNRFIIVGYELSKNDVLDLKNRGRVCVDDSKNEVAVEIPRALLTVALEEMKKYDSQPV